MTRQHHLQYCKICTHSRKDLNLGIVCGLNGRIAEFKNECEIFQEHEALQQIQILKNATCFLNDSVADKSKRFTNYLIDQLFVIGFGALFNIILGVSIAFFAPQYLNIFNDGNKLLDFGLGILISILYYSFFEGFTGRTLGKFFTKTKVVNENGQKPDFKTIMVRSLCRNIPFNALSFLSADNVGWHDKFSKTRVVKMDR